MADDQTDVFDPDAGAEPAAERPDELYRVYEGSRVLISKQVGPMWKRRFDAMLKAYEQTHVAWDEAMRYYNNNQTKSIETPRGVFKRGDSTENIVYSNVNVMLPNTYAKDPDLSCSTTDNQDEAFCKSIQSLINTLFRRRDKLNAKHKIKRSVGFAMLTNSGVLKLDWQKKDDSREWAMMELEKLSGELKQAKDEQEVDAIYGKMAALEMNMEVFKMSGPSLSNVLPHKLLIDPHAEDCDAGDAEYMIEEIFHNTSALNARYTKEEKKDGEKKNVLIYKPTHQAVFTPGQDGTREDGLGMVMQAMDRTVIVQGHSTDEREAAIQMEYTQCFLVWDKTFRRVMLFHRDDWTWPIWVWEDPFKLSRFFPYFVLAFGFNTGSTQAPGEVSYYLDQQDEINDINRQVAKIRRTVFDYWFYNSDNVSKDEAEKFVNAIRGVTSGPNILGVKAGERKISEMFETIKPPSVEMEAFFNKEPIMKTVDRITNTSDAMRGAQLKTNTTEDAVQAYQEASHTAISSRVDPMEDMVADLAYALAELCIQNYTKEDVIGLIGEKLGEGWQEGITLERFRSEYSLTLVAGSMEKPNSQFKKKEAVQVAQAVGQFAQAAPGGALMIMLKVLEKAFTEVVISPEDWQIIGKEIEANLQKGLSTGGAAPNGAAAPAEAGGATPPGDAPPTAAGDGAQMPQGQLSPAAMQLKEIASRLPPQAQQMVVQAKQAGTPDEQILGFIKQQADKMGVPLQ